MAPLAPELKGPLPPGTAGGNGRLGGILTVRETTGEGAHKEDPLTVTTSLNGTENGKSICVYDHS